jgi:GH15 family glucan-1,4-alpha-glucosidase
MKNQPSNSSSRRVWRAGAARREPSHDCTRWFSAPEDKRVRGRVEAIEQRLVVDGFVRRTICRSPRLPAGEGAFLACTIISCFWGGWTTRAKFERLLAVRNDLGLLSEEYDLYKFLFDLTDGGNWLVDVHASS